MTAKTERLASFLFALALGLVATGGVFAREHAAKPPFKYVGGTMDLPDNCQGMLEMGSTAMIFKCAEATVQIPYTAIRFMQYRSDISRKVRDMKLRWKVEPHTFSPWVFRKGNRFFTIVYQEKEDNRADSLVLEVLPDAMRPYLAEIDVKAGKRVEVEGHEDYD
jgi:hypothetical protein